MPSAERRGKRRRYSAAKCAASVCGFGCRSADSTILPDRRQPPTFSGVKEVLRNACGIHGGRNPLPAKRTAGISRRAAKPGFFPLKTLLFHSCARGKRNCPSAISTPRFGLRQNPRLAGLRAFAPYRRAMFMGHSVWVLFSLSKAGRRRKYMPAAGVSVKTRLPRMQRFGSAETCRVRPKAVSRTHSACMRRSAFARN